MTVILLIIIYLSFISLGLPDSLLGSAWPAMQPQIGAAISDAGIILMIISFGTVISSLFSGKIIAKLGTAKVTLISVVLTAISLFGFSLTIGVWWLCIMAIPLGIGAGSVDTALNNFVALHFKAKHMSWLHCFWGIGATAGPIILAAFMAGRGGFAMGYRTVALIQVTLAVFILFSLPIWRKFDLQSKQDLPKDQKFISNKQALKLPYAKYTVAAFFLYSAAEVSTGLWASTFLVNMRSLSPQTAAAWVSAYYGGITLGRLVSGFLTIKFSAPNIIRTGLIISSIGIGLMFIPAPPVLCLAAFSLIGLGFAPIYPCMLQQTPIRFGAQNSQTIIGLQLAAGYLGGTTVSPVLGGIANFTSIGILPFVLILCVAGLIFCCEEINKYVKSKSLNC